MKTNTPQLRFSEFTDEWQEKKLGDIGINIIGLTYQPKNVTQNEKYPIVLRSSNIKDGQLHYADIVRVEENIPEKLFIKKNDILICTRNGSQRLIGKNVIIEDTKCPTTFGAFMSVFRSKYNNFITHLFKTDKYNKQIQMNLGARINQITTGYLNKFKFYLPDDLEQQKIADFLTVVDERIGGMEKKKELLEKYKKSIMQKIFSQQIRFKSDSGENFPDWEEKKLGEITYKINSNLSANTIEGKNGKYNVFGAIGIYQTLDRYDQENDYIAIVKDGAGVGRLLFCRGKSSVLSTLSIIKSNQNIDLKFLYLLLQTLKFNKYIIGGAIPHIYFKDYSKEIISCPSLKEQQKIAELLTSLDNKVELINKKLEQARLFKKSLFQKMFV